MKLELQSSSTRKRSCRSPLFILASVVAVVGLAAAIAAWLYGDFRIVQQSEDTAQQPEAFGEAIVEGNEGVARETQGAFDLALKTITLSQGEGGFELWRLKAEWANLHKKDDRIVVEQPRLTYFMREDGKILHVFSDTGDVDQKTQILRFIDNVRVTQESKLITGELLVYNGNEKTMTFPQGCAFEDTSVRGSARELVWHIERQLIEAEGDIYVFLSSPDPQSLEQSEASLNDNVPASDASALQP